MHSDRCEAVAKYFGGRRKVIGIELGGSSDTYDWRSTEVEGFTKLTLFPGETVSSVSLHIKLIKLLQTCLSLGKADFFFCHYEQFLILCVSSILTLMGRHVFIMNDSKYDDKTRRISRELIKSLFLIPYRGALVGSRRSADYLRFLTFPRDRIATGYDAISVDRVRSQAGAPPAPNGVKFEDRHFIIVARMVPKKNLFMALEAFAAYAKNTENPRALHLCGSGPLHPELQAKAAALGIAGSTVFHGSTDFKRVCALLSRSLALLLVSTEEQFGLVVPEALAMGVPVIVSANCGSRDELVRSAVNGFVVEPDNPQGIAYFMGLMGENETLWQKLAEGTAQFAPLGDVASFVRAVEKLCGAQACE